MTTVREGDAGERSSGHHEDERTDARHAAVERERKPPGEYFAQMMKVAGELGCQLQQNPQNRNQLRGLCPFHEAETLQNLKTLVINTNQRKFWCTYCNTGGNPLTFMAMSWSTSAWDARVLAESVQDRVGAERPPYPGGYFIQKRRNTPVPQNTAVLTLATRYYRQNVTQDYDCLFFLARLGIRPEQAQQVGIGFCNGRGLMEFLEERGIPQDEIESSPLFSRKGEKETMMGRITLSDLDYTGATTWMTSAFPQEPDGKNDWPLDRPGTYGLPGLRPYIFNNKAITRPGHKLTLTDDFRLHLLLASNNITSTLVTRKHVPGHNEDEFARHLSENLCERGIRDLTLAAHNRQRSHTIRDQFLEQDPSNRVKSLYREEIIQELNLSSRDLQKFRTMPRERVSPRTTPPHEDPGTPGT